MSPLVTGPAGQDVHIERLALRVAGLDSDAARALARLVAEGLAAGLQRPAAVAGLDHLAIDVNGQDDGTQDIDALARRIVDGIGRALARDRVTGSPDGETAP
jgi:hypothetical protein